MIDTQAPAQLPTLTLVTRTWRTMLVLCLALLGSIGVSVVYAQRIPIQVEAILDAQEQDIDLAREILTTFSTSVSQRGWQFVDLADTDFLALVTVRILPPRVLLTTTIRDRNTGFLVAAVENRAALNLTLEQALDDAAQELVLVLEQIVIRQELDQDPETTEISEILLGPTEPSQDPELPESSTIITTLVPQVAAPPPQLEVPGSSRDPRNFAVQLHSSSGRGPSMGAGFRWTPLKERLLVALEVDQGISQPIFLTDLRIQLGIRLGPQQSWLHLAMSTGFGTMITTLAGRDIAPFIDPYWQIIAMGSEISLGPIILFARGNLLYQIPVSRSLLSEGISSAPMPLQFTVGVMYPW